MTEHSNIAQHPAMTDEDRRRQLREKIEAGQQRNAQRPFAEQARDAADSAVNFVRKHPVATIAGGVTLGILVGAMTRPGRRAGLRLGRRGSALAAFALDAAMAYGLKALNNANGIARDAGDRLEDIGDAVGTQARNFRRESAHRTELASDALRVAGRKASRKGSRTLRDLRSRFIG